MEVIYVQMIEAGMKYIIKISTQLIFLPMYNIVDGQTLEANINKIRSVNFTDHNESTLCAVLN